MVGVGALELLLIVVMFLVAAVPVIAGTVFLGMLLTGKFRGPKKCPNCGAELRR
jgi:hypothetical protein